MKRGEMIEVLIQDRINDWVYASNTGTLVEVLMDGWKGYGDYTYKELKEELEMRFEQDDIDQLFATSKWRKEREQKIEADEKQGIYTDPFE
jgi:hypothetical protein